MLLALVVIIGVCYYFFFLLPKTNQEKIDLQTQQMKLDEDKLKQADQVQQDAKAKITWNAQMQEKCMQEATANYNSEWSNDCAMFGKTVNCSLPTYAADAVNKNFKDARDICISRYPN